MATLTLERPGKGSESINLELPEHINLLNLVDTIDTHLLNKQKRNELNITVFAQTGTMKALKKIHTSGFKKEGFPYEIFIKPWGDDRFDRPINIFSNLK